ncbi:uncharacterized protein BDZ83DRAFT_623884 [Colletotrichum acutatum]|uniref:Secreted protein n=1 Tax=Glomerella acutata TaxID=27357 RepID=A0AAD8ULM0_GLOAC|nr:uncharacterized protein BDZ83DRAFT_623884 [Colletotrichum acutatum]KAK1724205.1 hypothetical protein BDZ83DRAFT_623884 [Colletotrichum acutatum]
MFRNLLLVFFSLMSPSILSPYLTSGRPSSRGQIVSKQRVNFGTPDMMSLSTKVPIDDTVHPSVRYLNVFSIQVTEYSRPHLTRWTT